LFTPGLIVTQGRHEQTRVSPWAGSRGAVLRGSRCQGEHRLQPAPQASPARRALTAAGSAGVAGSTSADRSRLRRRRRLDERW